MLDGGGGFDLACSNACGRRYTDVLPKFNAIEPCQRRECRSECQ
jgi:hypothetical protein